jgi:hypothetical protein
MHLALGQTQCFLGYVSAQKKKLKLDEDVKKALLMMDRSFNET